MLQQLVNWLFNLVNEFSLFGEWLVTKLDYINMTPLELISYSGIVLVIGFLIVRLVVGG